MNHMSAISVLKKGLVLALVIVYCVTTPMLSTFHIHCPPAGGTEASLSTLTLNSAKGHPSFCDVCFRITTSSLSLASGQSSTDQIHPLAYRKFETVTPLYSQVPVLLPARAPPSL